MAMLLNEQVIAISGAQLEAVKQELINLFQEKRITFDGTPDVLLTTALDQVLGIAKGKCSIVDANTLPATTTPSTLYFVKTYNGNTKTVGRHLILTDSANASVYLGETSSESAANFVEKSQVVTSLGDSNYYYSFGDYLTKTIADGSVTLYSLTTDETGDITNITTLPMQGTLSGGVLTYNGNTYNHISEADGYYIVGYQNKVVAVSALRGLKAQGGSGGGGGGGGGGTQPEDVSSQITNNLPDYIDYIKALKTGGRIDITVVTKGRSLGTTSPIIPKWTKIFTIGTAIKPTSALFVDKGLVFVTAPTSDISSATSGWAAKSSQVFVKSGTGQVWTMQDMNFSSGNNVMIPGTAMFSYYIA